MKTANELFERLNSDEAFRREIRAMVVALKEGGAENLFAAMAKAAESLGYAVTEDEVRTYRTAHSGELSDELLNNISGGANYPCLFILY